MSDENKKEEKSIGNKFNELFDAFNHDSQNDTTIFLNDDEGNELAFEFLDLIAYENEEYVVLLPIEDEEGVDEVLILMLEKSENENEEVYTSVDDETALNAVFEIFKERFKDEFNFID